MRELKRTTRAVLALRFARSLTLAGMEASSSAALAGDAEEHRYTLSYAVRQHDDVADALDIFWKTMLRSAVHPKTVELEGKTESVIQKDDVGLRLEPATRTCASTHSPCGPAVTVHELCSQAS